jgi:hypothetical protein
MKTLNSLLGAIILSACTGLLLAGQLNIDPQDTMLGLLALAFGMGMIGNLLGGRKETGIAAAGLLTEVWLGDLLGKFWDNNDYLADGKNLDPFVDNDKINLQEIGASPNVQKNRSVYPVPMSQRADVPIALPLDDYSSDSTVIRDVETVALNYDKRKSVVQDHKDSLYGKIADDGIYNIAPTTNTAATPVIKTTGSVSSLTGLKTITDTDIAALALAWDKAKYPADGRVLLVHPDAFWDFVNTNPVLKEQASKNGSGGTATGVWVYYLGFIIKARVTTAYYNKTSLNKLAYGAVPGAGDAQASIAYLDKGRSFGRAMGTAEMYAKLKDPDQQGDVLNFRMRAMVLPFRQKCLGAIIAG